MIYFHLNWSKRETRKRTQFPSLFVRYMADNQIQKWGHNENHLIKVTIYSIPCIVCPLSSPRRSVIYLPPYWEPYTQTICRRLVDFRFDGSSGYLFLNSPPRDVSNKSVLTLAAHLPSLTEIFSLLHFIEDSVGKVSEFARSIWDGAMLPLVRRTGNAFVMLSGTPYIFLHFWLLWTTEK